MLFDFHLISQEIEIFKIKCYFMVCKGLLVMLIIKTAELIPAWVYMQTFLQGDFMIIEYNCSCISAFLRAPIWFPQ